MPSSRIALLALLLAPIGAAQAADEFRKEDHLTGDWGGLRADWRERGIDVGFDYVGEFAANTSGGARETSAYADQFHLALGFDLDKLWGWSGAQFQIDISNRNGELLNNEAGLPTLLQVQEIYGRGSVTRLSRFYYQQWLFDGKFAFKLGRMDVGNDFMPFACDFNNLSFCGSLPGYISNSWYTFPISLYGGILTFKPTPQWQIKLGGYDANSRVLDKAQGLKLKTPGKSPGTLMIGEVSYLPTFGNGLDGAYRVGAWRNSTHYPDVLDRNGLPATLTGLQADTLDEETGYYAMIDQRVWNQGENRGLSVFANLVRSDADTDRVDQMLSAGLRWQGPLARRPNDQLSLALGRNRIGSRLSSAQRRYNAVRPAGTAAVAVQEEEYPVELNYRWAVTPAIALTPGVQYIRHAAGVDGDNAFVYGLRVGITF